MPEVENPCEGLGHVRLLAGTAASGQAVFEVLPAEHVHGGIYVLHGSPGLTYGCAAVTGSASTPTAVSTLSVEAATYAFASTRPPRPATQT